VQLISRTSERPVPVDFLANRSVLNVANSVDGIKWKQPPPLDRREGECSYPAVTQGTERRIHITNPYRRAKVNLCRLMLVISRGRCRANRMAIGTERNAINHQGKEPFDRELARLRMNETVWDQQGMRQIYAYLRVDYFGSP
jgi:hypothetical protein